MPIPTLLTVERPRLKRAKSDETAESERFFDDDTDTDSILSSKPAAQKSNLTFIVVAIFGIGFTLGQILPPLVYPPTDTRFVGLISDAPTASPTKQRIMLGDDLFVPVLQNMPDGVVSPSLVNDIPILEAFQTQNLTLKEQASLLPSPDLTDQDLMELYSIKAYQKLQDKLQTKNLFRICINGGSSSAGGGNVDYDDLFFVQFAGALESNYDVTTDVVNRAHGDRNSMHSAILGDTFFIPNVDLLIWEFSINDQGDGATEARNELILWLHKLVDIYGDEPPLVLLVYLWNKPFTTDKDGQILSDVYHYHAQLAAEYEFVLGHVNLATYVNSLHWTSDNAARYFLADAIHPNQLAHAAISKLMVEFAGTQLEIKHRSFETLTEFDWTCGDDMEEQWRLQTIFQGDVGGMAKVGFTAEIPRTTDPIWPRIFVPHKEYTDGSIDYDFHLFHTQRYGKAAPGRADRHRGVVLPCCDDGTLDFQLTEHAPLVAFQFLLHAKEGVDGGHLGRRLSSRSDPKKVLYDDLEIVVNDQDYTSRIISALDWNCLLSNEMFSEW
eukprot:CAMPEP_0119028504 /NCGR_PEP_ID=MMETSP1176-20130426/39002_1 /TAXON_ID=265551 /ORGANISM="Synedropsis recta cf, Strain CCMP1620" /LENGTH=552 /DNA_ID=CAMNT_0006984651 /DNA_START=73 /DNA_END=1728 /DNA_ORIENTATION=+